MDEKIQESLLDENMDKKIGRCFINDRGRFRKIIHVIYEDGSREDIFSYNPMKYDFDPVEFIGKTKLEAVFYCDRKSPLPRNAYGHNTYGRF